MGKVGSECRGGLEENLAMAENLYNLVERIALVLPEALNTWRAQSEQGFLDVTERLLETAIVHLEEQSKNLRSSSEDNITSSAIGFFNRYGIRASSQTNSRGHVDIYISHTWRSALVICGEAKIWRGVSYHVDGLGQVLGYCTGRLPYCFLLAYVVKGEVEKHVENLKRELDQSFPEKQQGFSVAHPSLRWALVTQHKHSGGNLVRVLHAGVKLC